MRGHILSRKKRTLKSGPFWPKRQCTGRQQLVRQVCHGSRLVCGVGGLVLQCLSRQQRRLPGTINSMGHPHWVQRVAHCPEGARAWVSTFRPSPPVWARSSPSPTPKEKRKLQVAFAGKKSKQGSRQCGKPRLEGSPGL